MVVQHPLGSVNVVIKFMITHNAVNPERRTELFQGFQMFLNQHDIVVNSVTGQNNDIGIKHINIINQLLNPQKRCRAVDVQVADLGNCHITGNFIGIKSKFAHLWLFISLIQGINTNRNAE